MEVNQSVYVYVQYKCEGSTGKVNGKCNNRCKKTAIVFVRVPVWVNLVTDGLPATALSFRSEILLSYITQPNINLFLRYMVIGGCVGSAIVGASSYWFLIDPTGHQMSFWPLTK